MWLYLIFIHAASRNEEPQAQWYVNAKATLDLIIVDVPKDLPIPTVLDPVDVVPPWNQRADSLLEAVFVFAEDYLQDDDAMIVIHPF
jgi:hypothetical protein